MALSRLVAVLVATSLLSPPEAEAAQCACATENVHLRTGPGTSNSIITLLAGGQCLPYGGQSQVGGSYTWLHLDYHGQSAWGASTWLHVQDCAGSNPATSAPVSHSGVQLAGCPRIITRAEWGAKAATHPPGNMNQVPVYVFVHHGGAGGGCFDQAHCATIIRNAQNYYQAAPPAGRGYSDLGYNFMVGEDGNAYEVRGWEAVGAHTLNYNHNGIAICVIGDFTNHAPNAAALHTVQQLIQCGLTNGKISSSYTLKGHRDVGTTACPGDQLYHIIQSWSHYKSGTALFG